MPTIGSLTTLAAGKAYRSEVNGNFTTIRNAVNTYAAFVDTTATITGAWTFSTAPTFTNAQTFAAGVTITTGGLTVTAGASSFGAAVTITGTCTATTFAGSGASLTSIPAANLTGIIAAISGANLTNLNGSAIASGTVAATYLPTTYTNAITLSSGGYALTVSNQGGIKLSAAAGSAGSQTAMWFESDYVSGTNASTPLAFTSRAPVVGTGWAWVKMKFGGNDVWVPGLVP